MRKLRPRERKELDWFNDEGTVPTKPGPAGGRCSPELAHLCWEDIVSLIPDLCSAALELSLGQAFELHRHTADEAT